MENNNDIISVKLPYAFTDSKEIPYGHYNTDLVNPLGYNEKLIYNKKSAVWDVYTRANTTVEPEEYELQHNTTLTRHSLYDQIPGEKKLLFWYWPQAGETINQLILKKFDLPVEEINNTPAPF